MRGAMTLWIPEMDLIVALHDRVVEEVGGPAGLRSPDALAGATGKAHAFRHYGKLDPAVDFE